MAGNYKSIGFKKTEKNAERKLDLHITCDVKHLKPVPEKIIDKFDDMSKPKLLTFMWDIETYTKKNQTGEVPKPNDPNTNIFMICATIHYEYTNNAIAKVCIVDKPIKHSDDLFNSTEKSKKLSFAKQNVSKILTKSQNNYIIECKNEKEVCHAFAQIFEKMAPDITSAFNGGAFDWPQYRERMYKYKLMRELFNCLSCENLSYKCNGKSDKEVEEFIYKNYFSRKQIKISAEEHLKAMFADFAGSIDTDTMLIFKQLYPKSEVTKGSSLNFYLSINKLESKEGLPYKTMFKY